jgi:hypothetical protein
MKIKFKRFYFFDKEKTQVSFFAFCEVNGKGIGSISPSKNEPTSYFDDQLFTGLYDKYDKEIYVNDIIYWEEINQYGIFYFDPQMAYFKVQPIKTRKKIKYCFNASSMEIIGNKYNNPELIL